MPAGLDMLFDDLESTSGVQQPELKALNEYLSSAWEELEAEVELELVESSQEGSQAYTDAINSVLRGGSAWKGYMADMHNTNASGFSIEWPEGDNMYEDWGMATEVQLPPASADSSASKPARPPTPRARREAEQSSVDQWRNAAVSAGPQEAAPPMPPFSVAVAQSEAELAAASDVLAWSGSMPSTPVMPAMPQLTPLQPSGAASKADAGSQQDAHAAVPPTAALRAAVQAPPAPAHKPVQAANSKQDAPSPKLDPAPEFAGIPDISSFIASAAQARGQGAGSSAPTAAPKAPDAAPPAGPKPQAAAPPPAPPKPTPAQPAAHRPDASAAATASKPAPPPLPQQQQQQQQRRPAPRAGSPRPGDYHMKAPPERYGFTNAAAFLPPREALRTHEMPPHLPELVRVDVPPAQPAASTTTSSGAAGGAHAVPASQQQPGQGKGESASQWAAKLLAAADSAATQEQPAAKPDVPPPLPKFFASPSTLVPTGSMPPRLRGLAEQLLGDVWSLGPELDQAAVAPASGQDEQGVTQVEVLQSAAATAAKPETRQQQQQQQPPQAKAPHAPAPAQEVAPSKPDMGVTAAMHTSQVASAQAQATTPAKGAPKPQAVGVAVKAAAREPARKPAVKAQEAELAADKPTAAQVPAKTSGSKQAAAKAAPAAGTAPKQAEKAGAVQPSVSRAALKEMEARGVSCLIPAAPGDAEVAPAKAGRKISKAAAKAQLAAAAAEVAAALAPAESSGVALPVDEPSTRTRRTPGVRATPTARRAASPMPARAASPIPARAASPTPARFASPAPQAVLQALPAVARKAASPRLGDQHEVVFDQQELLKRAEEQQLIAIVRDYLGILHARKRLEAALRREATLGELAKAMKTDVKTLEGRLRVGMSSKQLLVGRNMGLIVDLSLKAARSLAGKTVHMGVQDLVGEGIQGFMRAVEKYDPASGCKLSTYAHMWIRQALGRAMRTQAALIRLPNNVMERVSKLCSTRRVMALGLGRAPTKQELVAELGWSEAEVDAVYAAVSMSMLSAQPVLSLEGSMDEAMGKGEGDGTSLLDSLEADSPDVLSSTGKASGGAQSADSDMAGGIRELLDAVSERAAARGSSAVRDVNIFRMRLGLEPREDPGPAAAQEPPPGGKRRGRKPKSPPPVGVAEQEPAPAARAQTPPLKRAARVLTTIQEEKAKSGKPGRKVATGTVAVAADAPPAPAAPPPSMFEGGSLQDVGDAANLTKERVRQIERKMLQWLREEYRDEVQGLLRETAASAATLPGRSAGGAHKKSK